jgi:hypothetical protein
VPGGDAAAPDAEQREREALVEILRAIHGDEARPLSRDELERQGLAQEIALRRQAFDQELALRNRYATRLLRYMAAQLLAANAVFVLYAALGPHWDVPPRVIDVWLGATVVQVVGVVAVVTHHLFPARMETDGAGVRRGA